jgi:hypothetical protein
MPCIKPSDGAEAFRFWWERWGKQAQEEYWKRQAAWLELFDKPARPYDATVAQANTRGGAKG